MKNRDKNTFEDDGIVIADMSGVDRQTPLGYIRNNKNANKPNANNTDHIRENGGLSKSERRSFIFGALMAALSIAAVFLVGLALTILFLQLLWH